MAPLTLSSLPFPLTADGQPAVGYQVEAGSLVLTAAAGTDMFVDPAGQGCTATFDQILFRSGAPADLRDGS